LQEVAFLDVDGEVFDQPLELGRLTDRAVRYGAVHAFALVEPDTGRSVGTATWGNALLTREPLREPFAFGLPLGADHELVEPPDSGHPLAGVPYRDSPYGTREPRCVVGGRLGGEDDVAVLSTHLTYAGTGQRRNQADTLAKIVDGLGGPAVLLGDLNAPIDAPELAGIATSFDDAFAAVGVPRGDPRRASSGPVAIDHVLTRRLTVEACHVQLDAGDASDHLPVVATLRQSEPSRSSSRAT
jgi:Endonuclease/Exonuclease/phosphatase family